MTQDGRSIVWRKSSASAEGNCVEVGMADESVLVRDTKNRSGGVLTFTMPEWRAFLSGVDAGEFSLDALQDR